MVAVAGIGGGRPAGHDQLPIMKSGGQQPLADRVHNRRACASGPKYTIMSFSGPFSIRGKLKPTKAEDSWTKAPSIVLSNSVWSRYGNNLHSLTPDLNGAPFEQVVIRGPAAGSRIRVTLPDDGPLWSGTHELKVIACDKAASPTRRYLLRRRWLWRLHVRGDGAHGCRAGLRIQTAAQATHRRMVPPQPNAAHRDRAAGSWPTDGKVEMLALVDVARVASPAATDPAATNSGYVVGSHSR